jgi:hypothetical protein
LYQMIHSTGKFNSLTQPNLQHVAVHEQVARLLVRRKFLGPLS